MRKSIVGLGESRERTLRTGFLWKKGREVLLLSVFCRETSLELLSHRGKWINRPS